MFLFFSKHGNPILLPWQPCLKTYCVNLDRENKDNENDTEPYTKPRILTDKLYIICIIKQEQINPKITKKSGKIIVLKEDLSIKGR